MNNNHNKPDLIINLQTKIHVVLFQSINQLKYFVKLTKNVSEQWPHVTRHIPGTDETGGVTGLGAKLIIRLQFGRGHAIR